MKPAVSQENLHRWLDDKADAMSEKVADLWLRGFSQLTIAKELGVSRKRVRTRIEQARKIWLERKNIAMADMVAEQLRRVDLIEAEAWEGYAKSKEDARETSIEKSSEGTRTKVVVRPQCGDTRFLKTAIECIDMRCKLLGIYKPPEERTEMEVWGVLVEVDSPEEANRIMEYSEFQGSVVDAEDVSPAFDPLSEV